MPVMSSGDFRSLVVRLKPLLVSEAAAIQDLGIAYATERQDLPGMRPQAQRDELVRQALLELLDEGSIMFFRTSWDEGWTADLDAVPRLSRDEVDAELARGQDAPNPVEATIFFTRTP
jgi:hypothetical protein